ncbi:MAG: aminomethyl-transferring glycine dehydrogenase subunit GcvPB [Robiginitomaculum sp.]
MSMKTQGRSTSPSAAIVSEHKTISGNRGLAQRELLIFEVGTPRRSGVDLETPDTRKNCLGGLERKDDIGLPGLTEPEIMRHYVRLSQKNFAIDLGMYPLGSCTMKHNPRLNEKMARLPGFSDVHPLQPLSTVQGAVDLIGELSHWICTLTGMPAVAMSPKAGAHGELCGMMAIRARLDADGMDHKRRVLVPESAHGTNPASAVQCGFTIDSIPATDGGRVKMDALRAKLGDDVAGIMLTNPNTCGLFECDIIEIADLIHGVGGYFYCDGANFTALVGRVRPGDLGIDAMHLNLHKTFSTPHGGGGPGSGPTVFSDALKAYAPMPRVEKVGGQWTLLEDHMEESFGRMTAFHGQMGMFTRALTYMMSHGSDGLKQATEDAVLNANYLQASLSDVMSPAFGGICMHEALFDDSFLKGTGVETLDFAKAMIDEGYHPMTMYFPLVVHGAMLIEPTESESKAEMDRFIAVMRSLTRKAKSGEVNMFKAAPIFAPMRRLDETQAARKPVLRWRGEETPA